MKRRANEQIWTADLFLTKETLYPWATSALGIKLRAGDRVRTGDIQLGRLTLYQLSYSRVLIFSVGRAGFEPAKLKNNRFTVCPRWPLEYLPYYKDRSPQKGEKFKEPMEGLEPTACWLQISCSSQLSYIGLCSYLRAVANVTINLVGFKKIKRHFDKTSIAFLYNE